MGTWGALYNRSPYLIGLASHPLERPLSQSKWTWGRLLARHLRISVTSSWVEMQSHQLEFLSPPNPQQWFGMQQGQIIRFSTWTSLVEPRKDTYVLPWMIVVIGRSHVGASSTHLLWTEKSKGKNMSSKRKKEMRSREKRSKANKLHQRKFYW